MLALAVELADYPLAEGTGTTTQLRSRTCGSTLVMHVSTDEDRRIAELGLRVTACAVGQAAAAIFAGAAEGRDGADIAQVRSGISAWLAGEGERPDWPRLEMLEPAVPHPGRHEAVLLPWKAAEEALFNPVGTG
jgi:NifU-like protein involved in Fe-S cluster formation